MNEGNYREYGGGCYFHPKEVVIGVCHLCLNERLLFLAETKNGVNKYRNSSKYDYYSSKTSINSNDNSSYHHHKPKRHVILPKIFAIASFFNTRDHSFRRRRRHRHHDFHHDFFYDDADDTTSTSLEDESFISIKFGENGVASWDKTNSNTVSKVSLDHCSSLYWGVKDASNTTKPEGNDTNDATKTVVGHAKPRPSPSPSASLRWPKRIGQLLQVIKWKKSSKGNAGGGYNSKVG